MNQQSDDLKRLAEARGDGVSNDKPSTQVIEFMKKLGYDYKVMTDSIYTDKRDVPTHFFQTKGADGIKLVSTIMAQDATELWREAAIGDAFGRRCPHCTRLLEIPARKPYRKKQS